MKRAKLDRSRSFGTEMPSGNFQQDHKTFGPDGLEILPNVEIPATAAPQEAEGPASEPETPLSTRQLRAEIKRRTGKAPKIGTPQAAMAAQIKALERQDVSRTPGHPTPGAEEPPEFG